MTGVLLLSALVLTADATKPSDRPLPNLSSVACAWDGRRLGWTRNERYPITNFVEYVELMTATGGNADRDMDESFAPLVDLCRKTLAYGLKPYLKLGNVPVRLTAGCDPRRRKQGGADGGSYGFNIRPPDDYEAYGRYMRSCAAALRDAFGRDEVRRWRFSVLTEANNSGESRDSGWFAAKGCDNAATREAFVRLYDVTVRAFEAELGEGLTIGTHLLDPRHDCMSFTHADVLAGCSPLRILPVSYYFGNPDGDQVERAGQVPGLAEVMRAAGGRVISGIDEGRICFSRPGAKSKDLRTRTVGQSYQAAFNVRMAKSVLDAGGDYIASWGFFAGADPIFAGVPTFDYFTARELAKFAGMRRCAVKAEGAVPAKEAVDAVAAVSSDERTVRVAVSRLRDKLEFSDSLDATLSVVLPASFAPGGEVSVSELTLDDRNNWFCDWERERREKGVADADYARSPDDANPLAVLASESARAFFASRIPAYAGKAARIAPRVRTAVVSRDGVLALPVAFCGNGAAFFEMHCKARSELNLAGTWRLSTPSATNVWDCAIPGDNASALLAAGFLRDPFWKGQEDCVQWLGNADWTFARTFDADGLPKSDLDRHYLEFDSIDTVAEVVLNGTTLGHVENEFRARRFNVSKVLRAKGNVLEVRVKAPRKEAEARWLRTPDYDIRSWAVTQCREINCLRKCQCSFGWDWGCSLPVSGIYGGVRIVSCLQRLEQPWAESKLLPDGSAEITVHTGVSPVSSLGGVCTFNGEAKRFVGDKAVFRLERPELWWPNGMGAQKLYDWSVDFDGQVAKGRLGIRTLELVTTSGAGDAAFGFRVNGRDFFTAGVDWIPCDAFPARRTPARIRSLLRSAADANVNCVRVWGGGTYESAAFYEACDELGLLVWQDFMFACARYPATSEFLAEIAAEAEHQVKRLRQYASILLWCGDNECIGGVREKGPYQDDWIRWNGVLAEAVAKHAPGTIWWPSSPCAGPGDFTYNELTGDRGDTHYWGVWHGSRGLDGYRMINPRFVSEFGYQSFPSETMFARSGNVIHQKNRGGNEKIDGMLAKLFPEPKDAPSRLYLSQVQQALAIETAVAYWRSLWPHCRGAVVWQLDDWWPVASWSSLEYDGRWKPLHYAMRRFYSSGYDAKGRDAELRDLDFRTKDLPSANVRIASVAPRPDGAFDVAVACDAKALFVWLEDPDDPATRFDDNLVDLDVRGRAFVCRPGRPTTAEALKARLTVRDLSSAVF